MKMQIEKTPNGNVVVIKIGKRFDISSHHLFSEACHLADDPTTTNIVVDLSKTRHLHDFGLALLLMLNSHAAALNRRISLINCHPKIMGQLNNAHIQAH
jgi:anti-anti-sigma factor